ncbi:MAG: hypothetical protein ABIR54_01565 [Burkholderiaceae bacterium]
MNANNLYRGLFELLTGPHDEAASSIPNASGRNARRELLSVARKEGCLPELYAGWEADNLLSPSEAIEHEQFVRRRASAAAVRRVLPAGSLLAGSGGLCRDPSTLEVLLADFAAIGPLHEAVGQLGYRLEGTGEWLVSLRDPLQRGAATFRYAMASQTQSAATIEVQVAGVPIDARRNLPFADLAEHAIRIDGLACRTLDPTRQVLHRIASFGARLEPVTVREIAEIHLLLKRSAQRIDHAWLQAKLDYLDAWIGLRQLREAIVAKRLSALLSWGEFGRMIEASVARTDAVATRRKRAPRAGTFLKNGFELLQGPRRNDVAAKLARAPWLVSRVWASGHRVCGVPVSTKAFDAPRLLRIDGALYLATGAGLILLSLVDLNDGARAAVSEGVRIGGRPVVLARWAAARTSRRARAGTP